MSGRFSATHRLIYSCNVWNRVDRLVKSRRDQKRTKERGSVLIYFTVGIGDTVIGTRGDAQR
jgi:hypothetical protein